MMFIKRANGIHYISKIEKPYRIWYPINLQIPRYGEDYVKSKLGVTDPIHQRDLRIEFYEATRNNKIRTDELRYNVLGFDGTEYPYYAHQEYANVVTVFIEKGLFTLGENRPGGYAWAVIYESDYPENIASKLYDDDIEFGASMKEELIEIMDW